MSGEVIKNKETKIVAASIIVIVAVATPRLLDMITACGHYIPQEDLPTDYLKGLTWALLLWLGIFLWPVSWADRKCLSIAWLAKIVMTLGVMLFYEKSYGLDAYMYFVESNKAPFALGKFTTVGNAAGTWNIVNLASLNNVILPDSYHAQKVSFAMLGLLGVYIFYRAAVLFLHREDARIFYVIAFFPGIFFWSSILGKEPVVFLGIALYAYGTIAWYTRRTFRSFLWIAAGVYLGILIRVWLGPIMVVPLVLLFLKAPGSRVVKLFLVGLTAVTLVVSAGPMLAKFKIQAFEDVLAAADKTTQGFVNTEGGSTQQLQVDLTSPAGALKFLPVAAFTALFRPLPGEVLNPFGMLAGFESALLLWLLFLSIRRTTLAELSDPLVIWGSSFIIIWSLVNGIVSSTNFGVGVRYKLQVLPLLLGVLSHLSRKREKETTVAPAVAERLPAPSAHEPLQPAPDPG